jgi:uncharacterized membrane protein
MNLIKSILFFSKIRFTHIQIHRVYFPVALFLGLVMTFLIPPFQVPDEITHYYRSVSIAEFHPSCIDGQVLIGKTENELPTVFDASRIGSKYNQKFNYDSLFQYGNKRNLENEEKFWVSNVLCLSTKIPFGHLVSGIGNSLGVFISSNVLIAFYMGRISNLIVAVLLTTFAIKLIPSWKNLLFVLGLLPMTIFLYASYNYDAILIPLIFFYTSFILYLYKRSKPLRLIELIELVLLTLVVTSVKMGFQLIVFLPFILLGRKYLKSFKTIFFVGGLLFCIMLFSVFLVKGGVSNIIDIERNIDPSQQLHYVLEYPLRFISVIIKTISLLHSIYIYSFIGVLGWLDYVLPILVYKKVFLLGIILIFQERKKIQLPLILSFIFIVSILGIFGTFFLSMYLISSSVSAEYISGVQGRYFIGISFPLLLGLYGCIKNITDAIRKCMKKRSSLWKQLSVQISYHTIKNNMITRFYSLIINLGTFVISIVLGLYIWYETFRVTLLRYV